MQGKALARQNLRAVLQKDVTYTGTEQFITIFTTPEEDGRMSPQYVSKANNVRRYIIMLFLNHLKILFLESQARQR